MNTRFSFFSDPQSIAAAISAIDADKVFILADAAVADRAPQDYDTLVIEGGDTSKNIDTLCRVWQFLSDNVATRKSVLVNFGGGMVCDLGGFGAATFKRGIRFVNVPTTLLAAVDAGIGGKTGINFCGRKNEVGAFAMPLDTFICTRFFDTLPDGEWLSGVGELAKTYYIANAGYRDLFTAWREGGFRREESGEVIESALRFKEAVVSEDPTEQGLRKCLNFGHTVGHAFESLMIGKGKPVPHGIAVAHGILVELILSHTLGCLPSRYIYDYASQVLRPYFGRIVFTCDDYDALLELMHHDKKNRNGDEINFTAIVTPGEFTVDSVATGKEVMAALDIYRDLID